MKKYKLSAAYSRRLVPPFFAVPLAVLMGAALVLFDDARASDSWWAWVSGTNGVEQAGIYGTKGVPAATNVPGARAGCAAWAGVSGKRWLFGGYGFDGSEGLDYLNDLWAFEGSNWTWVGGSAVADQTGVYGTKGVPAAANVPGARSQGVTWVDGSGKLWLFGGIGFAASGSPSLLNDLWVYNGTNWAWISGSNAGNQTGVYGTKGVANVNNRPGARRGSAPCGSIAGSLWLFGGGGYATTTSTGYLNDLWRFDGSYWTWVSGTNGLNQSGVYGTKGVPAPANVPGGRRGSVTWVNESGQFCLFGGWGFCASGASGLLNDLWMYNGTNWTWISGSNTVYQPSVCVTKGVFDPANMPGARAQSVAWRDEAGRLWLFGGENMDGVLSELWVFDGTNWAWISGESAVNSSGVYGVRGVAAPANMPGARSGSVAWGCGPGRYWIFGGFGADGEGNVSHLNDLWIFAAPLSITAAAGAHGWISPSGDVSVGYGNSKSFLIEGEAYYHVTNVVVDGSPIGAAEGYTFLNVVSNHTISAGFGENLAPLGTPEWWLALNKLNDGGVTFTEAETNDADGDGQFAWQEYVADTLPTNPASCFRIVEFGREPASNLVSFASSAVRVYTLTASSNLAAGSWAAVGSQTNKVGNGGTLRLADTNAAAQERFYRVRVSLPP